MTYSKIRYYPTIQFSGLSRIHFVCYMLSPLQSFSFNDQQNGDLLHAHCVVFSACLFFCLMLQCFHKVVFTGTIGYCLYIVMLLRIYVYINQFFVLYVNDAHRDHFID